MPQHAPPPTTDDTASPPATAAVAAALAEHAHWLRTVLLARGVNRDELDDVLQRTASVAIRGAAALRDPARAGPWLYRLAVGTALEHRRRAGRQRRLLVRSREQRVFREEAIDADPLDWLIAVEQQRLVRQAVATLPRRDAEILLLKYTENWTYAQLGQQLGLSATAVEGRLRRARAALRQALARLAPELAGTKTD